MACACRSEPEPAGTNDGRRFASAEPRRRDAVAAADSTRIVVTHGTDTMVDTARELRGMPGKTIVLTGALQPARFADSDAAFNLGLAIGAVQVLQPGVYIAANGQVFPAYSVRKNVALNRFESV